MLLSAVKQASDSVFVDLLTYQDLEALKQRKQQQGQQQQQQQQASAGRSLAPNNKRYLILTYAAEFDRVHYPLPLLHEDNPDPQRLRAVISSLRAELGALQQQHHQVAGPSSRHTAAAGGEPSSSSGAPVELRRLREENSALRQQLRLLDRAVRPDQDALQGGGADGQPGGRAAAELREMAKELRAVSGHPGFACSLLALQGRGRMPRPRRGGGGALRCAQVRKERDLLEARVEAAEAELERERGLHRRELRRKAKENQEVGGRGERGGHRER